VVYFNFFDLTLEKYTSYIILSCTRTTKAVAINSSDCFGNILDYDSYLRFIFEKA